MRGNDGYPGYGRRRRIPRPGSKTVFKLLVAIVGVVVFMHYSKGAQNDSADAKAVGVTKSQLQHASAALTKLRPSPDTSMASYDRTKDFGPAWADVDHNSCDTRNDVLKRDLTHEVFVSGTHSCVVARGDLVDPYTGRTIHFVRGVRTSTAVQIDHVVSLGDAWETGAQKLSASRREQLANDPKNLLAVDGPTNEKKGDRDASRWLPPNTGFRCAYIVRQVDVKVRYHLWVTLAEKNAMARVLRSCS